MPPPSPLVVVVEDDAASRKTLGRVLRAGGFQAVIYGSAEEFLDSPPLEEPLGMLLDIHLPALSGLDLQGQLREQGSSVPVIIITAYDDERARRRAESQGCVAFLRKPCQVGEILSVLEALRDA